jgi:hypothetical protein
VYRRLVSRPGQQFHRSSFPVRFASRRVAPSRFALLQSIPARSVSLRLAPVKIAPLRLASPSFARLRSAPLRLASLRLASPRCGPTKKPSLGNCAFQDFHRAELRLSEVRPTQFRSLRSASVRSGNDPGFLVLQSFQIAVPCSSKARCSAFAMNKRQEWGLLQPIVNTPGSKKARRNAFKREVDRFCFPFATAQRAAASTTDITPAAACGCLTRRGFIGFR